jgi:hypothetical protein
MAAGALQVNPPSAPPGASITVSATGFSANETGISLAYDGTVLSSTIAANTAGAWSYMFTLIPSIGGSHTLTATGPTTGTLTSPLIVIPIIALDKSSGTAGTSVTVTGSGFGATEGSIVLTFDGALAASGIVANAQGAWTKVLLIPPTPSGSHAIGSGGATTLAASIATVAFTVSPLLTLKPTSGAPGASITVSGSGFASGETGISVSYDGRPVASGIAADSKGSWSKAVVAPASSAGSHNIGASGTSTLASAVQEVVFGTVAGISVDSASGAPGASFAVTGFGFGSAETGIVMTFDGKPLVSGITANAQGGWSKTATVPPSPAGDHSIGAGGSATPASTIAEVPYSTEAGITVAPSSGDAGTSVSVDGFGFAAGETGITVTYDGKRVGSTITASPQGSWKTTFTVPESGGGPHPVGASGPTTKTSDASFSIGAGVTVDPGSGTIGSTVEVSGTGFASNSPLRFFYDDSAVLTGDAVRTGGAGSFTQTVTIPKSKHGSHTIRVVDHDNNEASAAFKVDSTPPGVPRLVSPGDGAGVGTFGSTRPTFRWSSTGDLTGVTFNVEVDTTPAFSQPVLDKKGITGTRYTVGASDSLPSGEYYWRVKAVDAASNESDWSDPQLFKAGMMPAWVPILLVILIVAVVVVVAYLVARRILARRKQLAPAASELNISSIFPMQARVSEALPPSRPSPMRLALPQPNSKSRSIPAEDMAHLKMVLDFAQSLPLVEPGFTSNWVVDLIQSGAGGDSPSPTYEQMLEGTRPVRYEPNWMHHPSYNDLTTLLRGQPVLSELNGFVDVVSRCAEQATSLLRDIYRDAVGDVSTGFLARGGGAFVGAVYTDAVGWYLGRSLRDASPRDYATKQGGPSGQEGLWLWGAEGTTFPMPLLQVTDDAEAAQAQALHLRLRQTYRNDDGFRQLVGMMTQVGLQRQRLIDSFAQLANLAQ